MPNKGKKYKGELAKPTRIIYRKASKKENPQERMERVLAGLKEGAEKVAKANREKLSLLFDHYNIQAGSENAWAQLAMALAVDNVPGFSFSITRSRGRKKTLCSLAQLNIFLEFEFLRKKMESDNENKSNYARRKITDSLVAEKLSKKKKKPKKTLHNKYIESRKDPLVKICSHIFSQKTSGTKDELLKMAMIIRIREDFKKVSQE